MSFEGSNCEDGIVAHSGRCADKASKINSFKLILSSLNRPENSGLFIGSKKKCNRTFRQVSKEFIIIKSLINYCP